jgi:rod shape determining protein RodA
MLSLVNERIDLRTVLAALGLTAIGIVSVYSATYDARASEIFYRQLFFLGAGLIAAAAVAVMPFRLLQFISYPSYALSLLLLVAVLLIGRTVSGSTSWFNLGLFRLQPAEFAKITTVLALATYLSRPEVSLSSFRHLAVVGGIVGAPMVLILRQPDTGTAIIYAGMLLPILYWGGATRFTLTAILAPVAAAVAALFGTTPFLVAIVIFGILLYLSKENRLLAAVAFSLMVLVGISVQYIYDGLRPYQQKRIATFLDPAADPLGAGFNILQSKVAIGSGGLVGKGYLHGSQTQLNFIPEQWTDFIFCVPGEEFGFLGAATVLALFLVLFLRGVGIASSVRSRFASYVAIGITGTLATHMVINVGMALGLLPVIGVPLPFLSYGGSALVTSLLMVGILLNLHLHRKEY